MSYNLLQLSDRAEIHDVIVRYGWAIDTKDWALLDTCFTDDAEVDYSSNPPSTTAADASRASGIPITRFHAERTRKVPHFRDSDVRKW